MTLADLLENACPNCFSLNFIEETVQEGRKWVTTKVCISCNRNNEI